MGAVPDIERAPYSGMLSRRRRAVSFQSLIVDLLYIGKKPKFVFVYRLDPEKLFLRL
jgi:hypothetical protein